MYITIRIDFNNELLSILEQSICGGKYHFHKKLNDVGVTEGYVETLGFNEVEDWVALVASAIYEELDEDTSYHIDYDLIYQLVTETFVSVKARRL